MPTSPTAVAILEFGKIIHNEERRHRSDQDRTRITAREEQLLELLRRNRATFRKTGLQTDTRTPQDSTVLRVVAYVAYQQLCSTRLGAAVCDIVRAVAGEDPSAVLETRQVVSRLLIAKQLELRNNHSVELGKPILVFLAGGENATPLTLEEWELRAAWGKAEAQAQKAKMRAPIAFDAMPTAKQLSETISRDVVGLDSQVRTVACRMAMHIRRAALLRVGKDPGSPNEAMLFVGNSGTGKTFLAEVAGRVCGVPFAAIDCNSLTCEGYVGLGIDDALKELFTAAGNDIEKARYGICFLDEIDKKRASGWEHGSRDVAGSSVQQGLLRVIEGCEYQIGGRKGSYDWAPMTINTRGMFFTMAGAFDGLEKLLGARGAHGIGFGARPNAPKSQAYLYDALQEFGMIPELLNRLSGVIVFPDPTVEQLVEIANRSVLPSTNRLLSAFGACIEVHPDGIQTMAEFALESRTFARGIKSLTTALVEDIVFDMHQGPVRLGAADVLRAIECAGLAAVG